MKKRRYSVAIIGSKGRYFPPGAPIDDDVTVPAFADKYYRIRDEEQQRDESASSSSTLDTDKTTGQGP